MVYLKIFKKFKKINKQQQQQGTTEKGKPFSIVIICTCDREQHVTELVLGTCYGLNQHAAKTKRLFAHSSTVGWEKEIKRKIQ